MLYYIQNKGRGTKREQGNKFYEIPETKVPKKQGNEAFVEKGEMTYVDA